MYVQLVEPCASFYFKMHLAKECDKIGKWSGAPVMVFADNLDARGEFSAVGCDPFDKFAFGSLAVDLEESRRCGGE